MCHTNQVSEGVCRQFVPTGLEAAWELFHFTGMFGTSEAAAESVGGLLKMYGKSNMFTGRVVESTILRWSGVRGTGGDDEFLSLCWAKFFGGASPDVYKFDYTGRAGNKRARLCGGSDAIHKRLHEAFDRPTWTTRDLRLSTRRGTKHGPPPPQRSLEWDKALIERRQI